MTHVIVQVNADEVRQGVELTRRQFRTVTMVALTRTAQRARTDLQDEMRRAFDRPTPYTLNSMQVEPATRDSLTAAVSFKSGLGAKSNAPEKWIGIGVRGGVRRMKRAERALSFTRGGQQVFLVPTKYAQYDSYGNASRAQLVKILSALQALGDASQRKDRKSRGRRKREEYFAVWTKAPGLPPAIYQRRRTGFGNAVVPIYTFAKAAPTYRKRFDFEGKAQASARQHLPGIWSETLRELTQRYGWGGG